MCEQSLRIGTVKTLFTLKNKKKELNLFLRLNVYIKLQQSGYTPFRIFGASVN